MEESRARADVYDVTVGVHYLYRPLFPALVRALRPGGLLLYETFLVGHAGKGPTNPAFLLAPGELPALVSPLLVVRQREGELEDRRVASVAAIRQSAERSETQKGEGRRLESGRTWNC